MKTLVRWKGVTPSPSVRALVNRKMGRLDRLAGPEDAATVVLSGGVSKATDAACEADIVIAGPDSTVRGSGRGATPVAALDEALDHIDRVLVRARERPRKTRERIPATAATDEVKAVSEDGAAEPTIRKVTRVDMVPLFIEDAILQMEELRHAFFLFLNAESGRVAVVYRRKNGGYGLIEPDAD